MNLHLFQGHLDGKCSKTKYTVLQHKTRSKSAHPMNKAIQCERCRMLFTRLLNGIEQNQRFKDQKNLPNQHNNLLRRYMRSREIIIVTHFNSITEIA